MSEHLQDEIRQTTAAAEAALQRLEREMASCERAASEWIASWGADLAKRRVTKDKPERAKELGAEAIKQVREAVACLAQESLTEFRRRVPESVWPHRTISEHDWSQRSRRPGSGPYGFIAYGQSWNVPKQWDQAARRMVGRTVGRALVDAGFDTAGETYTGPLDWYSESDGELRYPFSLPSPAPEVVAAVRSYDTAFQDYVKVEGTRRELVERSKEMTAEDLWGEAGE